MKAAAASLITRITLVLTFCLIVAALPVFAVDDGLSLITAEVLNDMIDEKKSFTLIDARTKEEFQEAHIVSAINIVDKDLQKSLARLPTDRSAFLVLYCNGSKCGKSRKMAMKVKDAGYTKVVVFDDGFPVWEEKGLPIVAGPDYAKRVETTKLSPEYLAKALREKGDSYVVVDVRDESEFAEGHIPGAVNVPGNTFATMSSVLPREKAIVVYCNSGGRSYSAYRKLMKLAYPTIYQSILADWKEAGLPVIKSQL